MKILVSIIIPMYNSQKYISQALESCLKQTYKNIEIIIVDDGSTDNSLKIVNKYKLKFSFIKVFSQKNMGASYARNKGFRESRGNLILFLDSDDLLNPLVIESHINILSSKDQYCVSFGQMSKFRNNMNSCKFKKLPVHKNYKNPLDYILNDENFYYAITVPHLWMINRKIIEKIGGWNNNFKINQDKEFIIRILSNATNVFFAKKACVFYREDNLKSISRNIDKKKAINLVNSIINLEHIILKKEKSFRAYKYIARSYKFIMYVLYPHHMKAFKLAQDNYERIGIKVYNIGSKRFQLLNRILPFTVVYKIIFFVKKLFLKLS